jgi:hypothetical protein
MMVRLYFKCASNLSNEELVERRCEIQVCRVRGYPVTLLWSRIPSQGLREVPAQRVEPDIPDGHPGEIRGAHFES